MYKTYYVRVQKSSQKITLTKKNHNILATTAEELKNSTQGSKHSHHFKHNQQTGIDKISALVFGIPIKSNHSACIGSTSWQITHFSKNE